MIGDMPQPFSIEVEQSVLDDLSERLARTKFADPAPGKPWDAGMDPGYLRELVAYWRQDYDWRAVERRLSALPHFTEPIDGSPVHFVQVKSTAPQAIPLVLTHGWPGTFLEMLPLVPLLTDAFDLVIPSLPGYVFSGPILDGPTTEQAIADRWAALMSALGYERFGVYGGDIGSGVSTWLAAAYPNRVIGFYSQHIKFPPQSRRTDLSPAEEAFVAKLAAKSDDDWGYGFLQETRPDTLAAALTDSPAGLAAWIVEKYQRWGDCGGQVERRFSKEDLVTTVMLYWVTGCIGTSFRPYRDDHLAPELPTVEVPAGITVSVEDEGLPREFAERVYRDLRHFSFPGRGGHFMAMEEPKLLADEMRSFFTPL